MTEYKFKAFISYSHADERHGEWLQRALEQFRTPISLVGKVTGSGEVPSRLTPIFRDRNDLPAAGNLNAEIQAALAASQYQIVLCSPNAAASRWVNEEIKLFKKLHGQERTLAIIVAGEPGASAKSGRESEECFPPALRFRVNENGEITADPAEPVAADARRDGDGRRYAILKLAAGLLGVGLDDLVRRDVQRRTRQAWTVAGVATTLAASMTGLALYADYQGDEARRMRGEAEGLITFMIGELRDKVEPLGRTDVLQAVGKRALAYYENQDRGSLDDAALGKRARSLALIAEMDMRRGSLDTALAAFEEAARSGELLLKRNPDNQQLIFDQAQTVFYIGEIAMKRNANDVAERNMLEYLRLAEKLVSLDPDNPDWRLELAYATSNIGAVRFGAGEFAAAIPYYERSAEARRALSMAAPDNVKNSLAYAYALSWIAFAALRLEDFARAAKEIEAQLEVYEPILRKDPDNFQVLDPLVTAQRRLADARFGVGDVAGAAQALDGARATAARLLERDPSNTNWLMNAAHIELASAAISSIRNNGAASTQAATRALGLVERVLAAQQDNRDAGAALMSALSFVIAGAALDSEMQQSIQLLNSLLAAEQAVPKPNFAVIGEAAVALADYYDRAGDPEAARAARQTTAAFLARPAHALSLQAKFRLSQLYFGLGDHARARALADSLTSAGYKHATFAAFSEALTAGP
ncbi:MAG: TIR domain-containing protein [Parvularculaceae bacterium]|nr:TIR domain-containing protein [Parvularculaceae bacterium]